MFALGGLILELERYLINEVYEDNHLLVVEKPVNLPSQADATGDPDLLSILKQHLKVKYDKPGNVYLGLVHRLDRPVGGVMVFAKTSKAAARLSEQIQQHIFEKNYLAVVHGTPAKRNAQLEHFLRKDPIKNKVTVFSKPVSQSKQAILDYQVLEVVNDLSLVSINLRTGRSHQIRAQLAAIGHPLYGDQKYGDHLSKVGEQLALWSIKVKFKHPVKEEQIAFESSPPDCYPWREFSYLSRE